MGAATRGAECAAGHLPERGAGRATPRKRARPSRGRHHQRAAGRSGDPSRARDGRSARRDPRSRWDDLDGNGILRVRTEKNGPDRWIQLAEPTVRLIETFRDRHGGCGLIFRSPVTGLKRGDVRRFWRWVKKKAKVEHIRFHDLRHTAASEMLRRGVLLREVQYVLGHSSARMTERCAHFAPTFKAPKALSW